VDVVVKLWALFAVSAVALTSSLSFAGTAAAAPEPPQASADQKGGKHFPMPAAEFRKKIDDRTAKARERMEASLKRRSVPEAQAKEVRTKFDAGVAQVKKVVDEVAADGMVTKDEAGRVRQVARQARGAGHEGHRARGKHHKK
jgi:hypothetical protein